MSDYLYQDHCLCNVCRLQKEKQPNKINPTYQEQKNQMDTFLKICPLNCLVPVIPTTLIAYQDSIEQIRNSQNLSVTNNNNSSHSTVSPFYRIHYFTRNKIKLAKTLLHGSDTIKAKNSKRRHQLAIISIIDQLKTSTNLILYYEDKTTIEYKHDLKIHFHGLKYFQTYSGNRPTFIIKYQKDSLILDEILNEKMQEKIQKLCRQIKNSERCQQIKEQKARNKVEYYANLDFRYFFQQELEFQAWILQQYCPETLAKYLLKLIIELIKSLRGDTIVQGLFQWCYQPPVQNFSRNNQSGFISRKSKGTVKLVNVKNLRVIANQYHKTFQAEYEQLVKNKLQSINIEEKFMKKFDMHQSNPELQQAVDGIFNQRLRKFQSEIKNLYKIEKEKAMAEMKKQRYTLTSDKEKQQIQKQISQIKITLSSQNSQNYASQRNTKQLKYPSIANTLKNKQRCNDSVKSRFHQSNLSMMQRRKQFHENRNKNSNSMFDGVDVKSIKQKIKAPDEIFSLGLEKAKRKYLHLRTKTQI